MRIEHKKRLDMVLGTLLLVILRPPVMLLGRLMKRDHSLTVRKDILFIKMQGGGSLVIALPALLGIRRQYANLKISILTTPSVAPFAESLGVFDEVICVNDRTPARLLLSGIRTWWRTFGADTVIDLEVYSRLTTVFSVLTAARNRIGFYLESTFWRRNVHTHLVFFNRFAGVYHFYDDIARLIGAEPASVEACASHVRGNLPPPAERSERKRVTIGHACSAMGAERMLTPEQWLCVFQRKSEGSEEFIFLGGRNDYGLAQRIIEGLKPVFPRASFANRCGMVSLAESVSCIDSSDEFWGIDSALLHYARLFGKKVISFWGPTSPSMRIRVLPGDESEYYYKHIPCSPCVHIAEEPPCHGRNACIEGLFQETGDEGALNVIHDV
jgi:ADP-heptose:LPS heptosyltransferase